MFGHFIQEHITQGKTAISNMVALVGRGWKQRVIRKSPEQNTQNKSYSIVRAEKQIRTAFFTTELNYDSVGSHGSHKICIL